MQWLCFLQQQHAWLLKCHWHEMWSFWMPSEMFLMESGYICTCMVVCDSRPHRHHPLTMLQVSPPPTLWKKRGVRRPPIGLVLGSLAFLVASLLLRAHVMLDGQMGKADGLIWHAREKRSNWANFCESTLFWCLNFNILQLNATEVFSDT